MSYGLYVILSAPYFSTISLSGFDSYEKAFRCIKEILPKLPIGTSYEYSIFKMRD